MWEFSLNLKSDKKIISEKIFGFLQEYLSMMEGLVTMHEENEYIQILVALKKENVEIGKRTICSCITEVICNDFKVNYIDKYLSIPCQDKIYMCAFKKALLNFDIETDKYMVKKALEIDRDIYVESFYHFKLKPLKDKWAELVSLANENKEYFLTDESFVDLLKFLVDNLDICEEEISIVKEEGGYRIYKDNTESYIFLVNEEEIVSSVIDLSPQRINLYVNDSNDAIKLLKQIFDERISTNKMAFQNIKKINVNR